MSSRFAFQVQNAIKAIVKHNNVQVKDNNAQHGKLLYAAYRMLGIAWKYLCICNTLY